MAITYSLALASTMPAEQVARELHEVGRALGVLEASTTQESLLGGAVTGLGTWVRVATAKARRTRARRRGAPP